MHPMYPYICVIFCDFCPTYRSILDVDDNGHEIARDTENSDEEQDHGSHVEDPAGRHVGASVGALRRGVVVHRRRAEQRVGDDDQRIGRGGGGGVELFQVVHGRSLI